VLRLIRHPLSRSFSEYAERRCAGDKTICEGEASGCSRPTEFRGGDGLCDFAPRRKADVLELPTKEIVRLEIPLISEARERCVEVWGSTWQEQGA
jgi:hypothetical protein